MTHRMLSCMMRLGDWKQLSCVYYGTRYDKEFRKVQFYRRKMWISLHLWICSDHFTSTSSDFVAVYVTSLETWRRRLVKCHQYKNTGQWSLKKMESRQFQCGQHHSDWGPEVLCQSIFSHDRQGNKWFASKT